MSLCSILLKRMAQIIARIRRIYTECNYLTNLVTFFKQSSYTLPLILYLSLSFYLSLSLFLSLSLSLSLSIYIHRS